MRERSHPDVVRVLERVLHDGLLERGEPCIALVSGGRDSVCLLDVLVEVCGAPAITVLHVNYALRGAQSHGDEQHVRRLCEAAGVACHVHRPPPPPARGNLQAWARDVRYGEASALASSAQARIVTGHTASDQVETVLYRLASSPGRRALLGMAARDGRLVRPLLSSTREDTAAYCRARSLAWREDATNDDEGFARGRVRHGLVEELRRVHPAAEANVLQTAQLLRDEAAVLDAVVATALAGRARISLDTLRALPPALARLVLVRLAEDAAGILLPGVGGRIEEIAALAPGGGSAELDVGAGVRAIVEYGVLRFERGERAPAPATVTLALPGRAAFGRWTLESELRECGDGLLGDGADPRDGLLDGSIGLLDADRLAGSLTVRAWRAGDRVRPLGLGGAKTLADLFGARRVPRAERHGVPVLECAGEIVWVPGVVTAERVRVRSATQRVVLLSARRRCAADAI